MITMWSESSSATGERKSQYIVFLEPHSLVLEGALHAIHLVTFNVDVKEYDKELSEWTETILRFIRTPSPNLTRRRSTTGHV